MAFQVSPGVNVSEIDATTVVPAVSTSNAAIACAFQWGPAEEIKTISSEDELVSTFGKPDNDTAANWFTAASFLAYSGGLQVVRTIDTATHVNAVGPSGTAALIKNRQHFDSLTLASAFYARGPGVYGNNIGIGVIHAGSGSLETLGDGTWSTDTSTIFDLLPGTSKYVLDHNGSVAINDEIHIIVVDATGVISGQRGTVLEKYAHVSLCSDARDNVGNINYFKEVINANSKYIWATGQWDNYLTEADERGSWEGTAASPSDNILSTRTGVFTDIGVARNGVTLEAGLGTNTTANATAARAATNAGYDVFDDPDTTDVGLIIAGDPGSNADTVQYLIDEIATSRRDCLVCYSPRSSDVVTLDDQSTKQAAVVTFCTNDSTGVNRNTSYAIMDSGWKQMYDRYNDVYRDVPLNGDIAGLIARTDETRDAWWSPAGYDRGQIKNVVKLHFNPNKTSRDKLYIAGVNPVVSFPGQGVLLFGDKTTTSRPSSFDRINVRRLFIVLEKAISRAAKFSLFEFNDEFTRSSFRSMVEPFLRTIKARRGIYDYQVVCDTTNNTAEVVDRNEFVGDIYIKPARSINFIQLNFIAVRTGVDFSEVAG
tara:strand:+ start:435 stop:2225 length:1791 start_codon:yes stop_codon:yes gene_type:complete